MKLVKIGFCLDYDLLLWAEFFPRVMFSCWGTERSRRELGRASTVDVAAILNAIHAIWPRRFIKNRCMATFHFVELISHGCRGWWKVPIGSIQLRFYFFARFFHPDIKSKSQIDIVLFSLYQRTTNTFTTYGCQVSTNLWINRKFCMNPDSRTCSSIFQNSNGLPWMSL